MARETGFYEFEAGGRIFSLEALLGEIESSAAPALKLLRRNENLGALSPENIASIVTFLAVQFVRTPAHREMFRSMMSGMLDRFAGDDVHPDFAEELRRGADDDQVRISTARTILGAPRQFGPQLANKGWMLLRPEQGLRFYIGDSPVTLQNNIPMPEPYGNLGIAVRGIEIYFPISPKLALAMYCPSLVEWFVSNEAEHLVAHRPIPEGTCKFLASYRAGIPFDCGPEVVDNFNSLQVAFAERHVFSDRENFELAQRVVNVAGIGGPRLRQR